MVHMTLKSLICLTLLIIELASAQIRGPVPVSPVPSPRQIQWQQMEFYGFLHFGINTFTDREWGYGDEPESLFVPTDFDAEQIVRTAKLAGMAG